MSEEHAKMTEAQSIQYLNLLMEGKIKTQTQMEEIALGLFKQVNEQHQKTTSRINVLESELENTKNMAKELRGQRNGYASLLVAAEEKRRAEDNDRPMRLEPIPDPEEELKIQTGIGKKPRKKKRMKK